MASATAASSVPASSSSAIAASARRRGTTPGRAREAAGRSGRGYVLGGGDPAVDIAALRVLVAAAPAHRRREPSSGSGSWPRRPRPRTPRLAASAPALIPDADLMEDILGPGGPARTGRNPPELATPAIESDEFGCSPAGKPTATPAVPRAERAHRADQPDRSPDRTPHAGPPLAPTQDVSGPRPVPGTSRHRLPRGPDRCLTGSATSGPPSTDPTDDVPPGAAGSEPGGQEASPEARRRGRKQMPKTPPRVAAGTGRTTKTTKTTKTLPPTPRPGPRPSTPVRRQGGTAGELPAGVTTGAQPASGSPGPRVANPCRSRSTAAAGADRRQGWVIDSTSRAASSCSAVSLPRLDVPALQDDGLDRLVLLERLLGH